MIKDLEPSQENDTECDGKDINAISREEGRYKSCHLFLSGDDSSAVSVGPSPGNVSFINLFISLSFAFHLVHSSNIYFV